MLSHRSSLALACASCFLSATSAAQDATTPVAGAQEETRAAIESQSGTVQSRDANDASATSGAQGEAAQEEPEQPESPESPESFGLTGDWGGARKQLEEKGITLGGGFIFDVNHIASGGLRRDTFGHSYLDITAAFDLAVLIGIPDATLSLDAYAIGGENPSDAVGDLSAFDGLANDESVRQVAELWYEQWLFDKRLRVKLGKADANGDFAYSDQGLEFLSSFTAWDPTLFLTLPGYPNPATGVIAFWQPDEHFYLGAGVYDGAGQEGVSTGSTGPSTFLGSPADLFLIGEAGHRWQQGEEKLAGRLALGAWKHTGTFDRFDGGTQDGTTGFYLVLDQEIARTGASNEGTLGGFFQLGWADADVDEIDRHIGAGLTWNGIFASRPDDACGFGASWIGVSDEAGFSAGHELDLELFYKLEILNGVSIKPDLQWIQDPGADDAVDDAFILSVRTEISF